MKGPVFVFSAAALGILLGILGCLLQPSLFLIVCAGAAYLTLCAINLKYGLFFTMLIRSSLDLFGEFTIPLPLFGDINIPALLGIFVIVLAVFALLTRAIRPESPLTAVFAVFLAVTVLSVAIGGQLGLGLQIWLKFATLAFVFLLVYRLCLSDEKNADLFLHAIPLSSVVPLYYGAVQFFTHTGNTMTDGLNRLCGTFVHPNAYAYYLLIVMTACFLILYRKKCGRFLFTLYLALFFLSFTELVFTYCRGGWLGLVILTVLIMLRLRDRRKIKLIALFSLCPIPFIPLAAERFTGLFSSRMEESSLATRLFIWNRMFDLSLRTPVLGHGPGTFQMYAQQAIGWHIEAHNEYLRMFFETGLVGLCSYLALTLYTLWVLRGTNPRGSAVSSTAFALFFTFLVMGAFDNIIDNLVSQLYLWAVVAIAAAEVRRSFRENSYGQ